MNNITLYHDVQLGGTCGFLLCFAEVAGMLNCLEHDRAFERLGISVYLAKGQITLGQDKNEKSLFSIASIQIESSRCIY